MFTLEKFQRFVLFCMMVFIVASTGALAQDSAVRVQPSTDPYAKENADQVAGILGLADLVGDVRAINARTACGTPATVEELAMRQDILESVATSSLEVDGVSAELANEHAHLSELRTALSSRRDKSLGLLNIANIITGSGLGIVTNALQFSNSTAKIGDNIGIVSGLGSTALSVIGIRRQRGPLHSVGRVPNMLAPLFGRQAELNGYYPPAVLEYLRSTPVAEGIQHGSRLDQLMGEWRQTGRIGSAGSPKTDQQIARLTSSLDTKTKLSIDDLSDRIAMLSDVSGRVGLMKRDLAELMRSIQREKTCTGK